MVDDNEIGAEQELAARLAALVNEAAGDPALLMRLLKDWRPVAAEHGIQVPDDIEMVFLPNREKLWYVPIPYR